MSPHNCILLRVFIKICLCVYHLSLSCLSLCVCVCVKWKLTKTKTKQNKNKNHKQHTRTQLTNAYNHLACTHTTCTTHHTPHTNHICIHTPVLLCCSLWLPSSNFVHQSTKNMKTQTKTNQITKSQIKTKNQTIKQLNNRNNQKNIKQQSKGIRCRLK